MDIPETGDYVIVFYTDAARNSDFVLGSIGIQATEFYTSGIQAIENPQLRNEDCYDLSGRRLSKESLKPGLYIINGKKVIY